MRSCAPTASSVGHAARASAVMASGTIVSRVLGLLKAILLAYAVGAVGSRSADAFANGNLLPNTIYMILIGGVLNAVLVPQIVKQTHGRDGGAADGLPQLHQLGHHLPLRGRVG